MRISDEEFEHEVETAIDSLPDRFKRALDNVGIAVADEPNERERATMQRQCDELLGLYEGVPITRRFTGYSGVMPDIITIYKGPHERVCATRDDLRRQIRKTVLHELGHYFGFDDDYLHAHGYWGHPARRFVRYMNFGGGVDSGLSEHLSAFQGVAKTRYAGYSKLYVAGIMRFWERLYLSTTPSKRR